MRLLANEDVKATPFRVRECEQLAIQPLLIGIEMALQIEVQISVAENRAETIAESARIFAAHQQL